MSSTFRVSIHYADSSWSILDIAAGDDAKAREKAIAKNTRVFKDKRIKMPKVAYCEVKRTDAPSDAVLPFTQR